MTTPEGTPAVAKEARNWQQILFRAGPAGVFMAFVLGLGTWMLHLFVPVWLKNAEEGAKAARDAETQKAHAMTEMAETMRAIRSDINNIPERCASAWSMMSKKR